jgi:hypothetical protein
MNTNRNGECPKAARWGQAGPTNAVSRAMVRSGAGLRLGVEPMKSAECKMQNEPERCGFSAQYVPLGLAGLRPRAGRLFLAPGFRHAETFGDTRVVSCVIWGRIRKRKRTSRLKNLKNAREFMNFRL